MGSTKERVYEAPWPPAELLGEERLYACLDEHLGLRLRGALGSDDCDRYARGVYEGRGSWNSDFGGEQFSLGRAWYTHLEQGRSHVYFTHAQASDRDVERFVPGLQRLLCDAIGALVGGEARPRRRWCGPGVHIFPAGEWVARSGGVVHFDTEGLTEAHLEAGERALSLVLMLQPPERDGGLRLWDMTYEGEDAVDPADLVGVDDALVPYAAGDLVVFDSYRLHQIQPFSGRIDRISATAHAARTGPGRWEVWFLRATIQGLTGACAPRSWCRGPGRSQ